MHKEILSKKQSEIFDHLKYFSDDFGLVGGTAIALHLGHRQSIDFDLASPVEIKTSAIRNKILKFGKIENVLVDNAEEYTLVAEGIKLTFFNYPFSIKFSQEIDGIISMPDIADLAAMKAYALGRRAKWKDYVDLYFVIQNLGSIKPIAERAHKIFKDEFNEKNFRSQLAYFKDIDYSEKIIFQPGFEIGDKEIKNKLAKYSL